MKASIAGRVLIPVAAIVCLGLAGESCEGRDCEGYGDEAGLLQQHALMPRRIDGRDSDDGMRGCKVPCDHGGRCLPALGICKCNPGWEGADCSVPEEMMRPPPPLEGRNGDEGGNCNLTFTTFPYSQTNLWGSAYEGWEDCNGPEQSPINIRSWKVRKETTSEGMDITFRDREGEQDYLKNSGYNLQLVTPTKNSLGTLKLDDVEYSLGNLHFHVPSEHSINYIRHAMEMHIVGSGPEGQGAVLGVLFQIGLGNPCLDEFFPDPLPIAGCKVDIPPVNLQKCFGDVLAGSWWAYDGSFTTPPCTEGLKWNVFKKRSTISLKQLMLFKTRFKVNARPPQPLGTRSVAYNKVRR